MWESWAMRIIVNFSFLCLWHWLASLRWKTEVTSRRKSTSKCNLKKQRDDILLRNENERSLQPETQCEDKKKEEKNRLEKSRRINENDKHEQKFIFMTIWLLSLPNSLLAAAAVAVRWATTRAEKKVFIVNVKRNGLIMKMPKNIVELSAILRRGKYEEDMRVKRFKWLWDVAMGGGLDGWKHTQKRLQLSVDVWNMNYENLKASFCLFNARK